MDSARATNELIRGFAAQRTNVAYIDVYSRMLGADGKPRADLFGPDRLHLNREGYALWQREIGRHLLAAARVAP
jgi:lysophospholipase L1-like esterase